MKSIFSTNIYWVSDTVYVAETTVTQRAKVSASENFYSSEREAGDGEE